jgi:hypothetical protein
MFIDDYELSTEEGDEAMPFAPLANPDQPGIVAGVADFDGTMQPNNGNLPLPVYAKNVKDIYNNVWPLSELTGGAWQAATVAKITLPDGTTLSLRLHTERNGDTLVFEFSNNEYYNQL